MRYYVKDKTLVIKGDFAGISTGIDGGRRRVRSVISREVGRDFDHDDPARYMDEAAAAVGADAPHFAFMTAVEMRNLCVVRDPYMIAFVTAGISNPCHDPGVPGTINLVLVIYGRMSEGALAGSIITATEAKTRALQEMGFDFTGTTTDAVAVLTEERRTGVCEPAFYEYSGTSTPIGQSIYRCVKKGVTEGIKRQHNIGDESTLRSRLFVLAQNDHGPYWIEHPSDGRGEGMCPYYPCHFEGQDCVHCYCPLYPCEDPELGEWIMSSKGYPVWTCKDCTLLHKKKVVEHLARHPDAPVAELKKIR